MKGERRKVEHSNKQEQPEALDQSRNTEKSRVRKPLDGGSENKPIEQSIQGGWNKSKSKRIKTDEYPFNNDQRPEPMMTRQNNII